MGEGPARPEGETREVERGRRTRLALAEKEELEHVSVLFPEDAIFGPRGVVVWRERWRHGRAGYGGRFEDVVVDEDPASRDEEEACEDWAGFGEEEAGVGGHWMAGDI